MTHSAGPGSSLPPAEIRTMFDRIAPIYDAMNTVMSAGLDARWRRSATVATRLRPGMAVLDVACGSGALTRELARVVAPGGTVTGVDISGGMLHRARRHPTPADAVRPRYVLGDAMRLPFTDAAFDASTIAFGVRNVPDYGVCLHELARVTRPGGRVVVLELATPRAGIARFLAMTWFERVVPLIGRLAGGGCAYAYLPASVRRYPRPEEIAAIMRRCGMVGIRWRRLTGGLVTLHIARRA